MGTRLGGMKEMKKRRKKRGELTGNMQKDTVKREREGGRDGCGGEEGGGKKE